MPNEPPLPPTAASPTPPIGDLAQSTSARAEDLPGAYRSIVYNSVLTGLCPLVPVPFLDDWIRDRLRRRLVRDLLQRGDQPLPEDNVQLLACGEPRPRRGCLRGAFVNAVFYTGKKLFRSLFRKILFVLALKDCADTFSTTFHHGYLLRHTLRGGVSLADAEHVPLAVRRAVEATCSEVDPRPIESIAGRVLRPSRRLLRQAARRLLGWNRRQQHVTPEGEQTDPLEGELDKLVDQLETSLGEEGGYLRDLGRRFDGHLWQDSPRVERTESV